MWERTDQDDTDAYKHRRNGGCEQCGAKNDPTTFARCFALVRDGRGHAAQEDEACTNPSSLAHVSLWINLV